MATPSSPREKPKSAMNHRNRTPKSPAKPTSTAKTHRAFTEDDEIQLLKALSEPTNKSELTSVTSTSQIGKKVKRLKERYHKLARSKSLIKTPHDHRVYEIGREIWGRKAAAQPLHDKRDARCTKISLCTADHKGLLHVSDEDVDLEDYPFAVSEMTKHFQSVEYVKEGLRRLGKEKLKRMNEEWMQLKLEESEVMVNKAQLSHENLKLAAEASTNNE